MQLKRIFIATLLVAAASSQGAAQTDNPNPGSGPSLGGSVAPSGVPGSGFAGLAGTAGTFASAASGLTVSNPTTGGEVAVPGNVAQAVGGVLGGSPSAGQRATASQAFGGNAAATALVDALVALGSNPNVSTVTAAIQAYNAAIQALPAGESPSPGLLAARSVLAGFVQK